MISLVTIFQLCVFNQQVVINECIEQNVNAEELYNISYADNVVY